MEEEKKNPGGRPPLPGKEKRSKLIILRLTEAEHEKLMAEMEEANFKKLAVYVRKKLTKREDQLVFNPRKTIDVLNVVGREVGAIGKNINQIARYTNYLSKNNMAKPQIMDEYNELLRRLTELELKTYKAVRGFFREGRDKLD